MAVITIDDLIGWAEETKLPISDVEDTLEEAMRAEVFSRVQSVYNVAGWTNATTTPALIRKVIGAKVVAATYRRAYSEVALDQNFTYADWLEGWANGIVKSIVDGDITLTDATADEVAGANQMSFWPNDTTGSTDQFDAFGNIVAPAGSEDIKFRMGTMF